MKSNVLYITDLKNGKPKIDSPKKISEKYNLFLMTQEETVLKFWEFTKDKFQIVNILEFIKILPNFKALNEFYDRYFSENNIQLVFLRFEDNRIFRFTKNAQYIVPIMYAESNKIPICYGRTSKSLLEFKLKSTVNNINFKNGKWVIYTAIFGGYEELFTPKYVNKNVDYICFTDDVNLKSDFWQIRIVNDLENLDNTRKARTLKILPHKYLSDYDFSIWVDAGFEIVFDVEKFLNRYSTSAKLLSVRHTERDCIYDEAEVCIDAKLDDEKIINAQMKKYKLEGYPHKNGLIESGILYRQHNDNQIIKVMDDWYHEIINFSKRDQLSFNYAAWKNKLRFDYAYVLYGKNQFFEHYYHLKMKSYQKTIDLFRILILDINSNPEIISSCIKQINDINENIPISIITEKDYDYIYKNVGNINITNNDLNSIIENFKEDFLFIIASDEYINYRFFELIYYEITGETIFDALIFEKDNNLPLRSNFENKMNNNEGILFKKQYLCRNDVENILNNEFIRNISSEIINKKLVVVNDLN